MEEHEQKDVEPDPAGAEARSPRDLQQGGLVAAIAWRFMVGVVVVVLFMVVVEIGVVELLVVGFRGLRLLELLLFGFTGEPLHITALGFRPLWRSIQQTCTDKTRKPSVYHFCIVGEYKGAPGLHLQAILLAGHPALTILLGHAEVF